MSSKHIKMAHLFCRCFCVRRQILSVTLANILYIVEPPSKDSARGMRPSRWGGNNEEQYSHYTLAQTSYPPYQPTPIALTPPRDAAVFWDLGGWVARDNKPLECPRVAIAISEEVAGRGGTSGDTRRSTGRSTGRNTPPDAKYIGGPPRRPNSDPAM